MKQYDVEFKNQLIKEATETGNVAMVARKHSIPAHTLYAWVRGAGTPKDTSKDRVRELEQDLRTSRLENAILKELLKKTNQAWLGDLRSPESSSRVEGGK